MTVPALPEESFRRVLCVVAHPDDMEYGTSAAVARWTARGIEVGYLLLTRGEAGMPTPPEETARVRVAEQRAACAVVGVRHLTVLDHPDGVLSYGLDLRRDICREIRRFRPDVVLGVGYEVETPFGFDQADHRAAGLATLDALRDAGNRWVFPEQVDGEDLAPHSVRWYLVPGLGGSATHGVDVTGEPLRRGIASLEAHAAYLAALPDHPAPSDFIPAFTAMAGQAAGVEHAVLFRAHDLQAPVVLPGETAHGELDTNELGQPVGEPVPGWVARDRPSADALVGRYCTLERLDPARHAEDLFAANRHDRRGESWTYLPYGPFAELASYRQWAERVAAGVDPRFYAVVDTDPTAGASGVGRAVGVLSLMRVDPGAGSIEVGHVHYSPLLQRRRAATEAQFLLMRHVFEDLGYRRHEWKCDALNAPSRAAAERLGFTYVGTFRQATVVKGRNRDTAWYSLLDREWPRHSDRLQRWLAPDNFDDAGRQKSPLREPLR